MSHLCPGGVRPESGLWVPQLFLHLLTFVLFRDGDHFKIILKPPTDAENCQNPEDAAPMWI